MYKMPKSTLCWDCANATGNCSWSEELIPVENWTAQEVVKTEPERVYTTYIVLECPEFIRDSWYYGLKKLDTTSSRSLKKLICSTKTQS